MAVTKLLKINTCKKSGAPYEHLKNSIRYICNPKKTGHGLWIGGNAGTTPDGVLHSMIINKKIWGKTDGRQGYHYILSFPPDENITEEICHNVAQDFVGQLLNDRYFYVTAVHNDKDHMHVHIVFDSVSKEDGLKFHSPKGDWEKRIQPITDQLCEKYHLSTLHYEKNGDRQGKNYQEWRNENHKDEKGGEPYTAYDIIRDDIDEAVKSAGDYQTFLQELKRMHYEITRDQKYLSLKPDWRKRAVRTGRLGKGYTKEELQQRIQNRQINTDLEERYRHYGDLQEIRNIIRWKVRRVKGWKMSEFQKQYYRRIFRVYHIRYPYFRNQAWKYKADILQVKKLSRCFTLMIRNDVNSQEDIKNQKIQLQDHIAAEWLQLNVLKTKLYKDERFRLLTQYENVERAQEKEDVDFMSIEKMLTQMGGVDSVKNMRKEIQQEMKKIRTVIKNESKEYQILNEIESLVREAKKAELTKGKENHESGEESGKESGKENSTMEKQFM